ncbi:hypothetical protein ZWY2020_043919 [Hordeum vulgare]|nr:hypothetical protein ZWY2020_043919 [Hordeum vulgare]
MVIGAAPELPRPPAPRACRAADTLRLHLRPRHRCRSRPQTPASLEEARKRILEEGIAVASTKRRLEATHREYNSANGLTPISEAPSRLGSVRSRGRFIAEVLGGDLPTYETPAANMRAAQAAIEEMASSKARSAA